MANCTNVIIAGEFTDNTLPVDYGDPVLAPGALMLLDFGRYSAGVPANGTTLTNYATDLARTLITTGDLDAEVSYSGTLFDGTKGLLERTTKGGLHGIVAQTQSLLGDQGLNIALPVAIMNYMIANKAHEFRLSVWARITRTALVPASGCKAMSHISQASTGYFRYCQNTAQELPLATRTGRRVTNYNDVGTRYAALSGRSNDVASDYSAPWKRAVSVWGPIGAQNGYVSNRDALQSHAVYRVYLEDLTASGRTFAGVDAIDHALYVADVETAGGRFYGDTFTDPATIP